jgi:hypothetical protein
MLYACVQRFDVTRNFKNIWELNRAIMYVKYREPGTQIDPPSPPGCREPGPS